MVWMEAENSEIKIDNAKLVICIAEIKNNETGEIREYETHEILEYESEYPNIFNWSENNYSCDCNRLLFFMRCGGESTDSILDEDIDCTEHKFSVNLKNKLDNKIYYQEF